MLKSQYYQKEKNNIKNNLLKQQNEEAFEINNEMKKAIIDTLNLNINKTLNPNTTTNNEIGKLYFYFYFYFYFILKALNIKNKILLSL